MFILAWAPGIRPLNGWRRLIKSAPIIWPISRSPRRRIHCALTLASMICCDASECRGDRKRRLSASEPIVVPEAEAASRRVHSPTDPAIILVVEVFQIERHIVVLA